MGGEVAVHPERLDERHRGGDAVCWRCWRCWRCWCRLRRRHEDGLAAVPVFDEMFEQAR
jgi:hypothetical protein